MPVSLLWRNAMLRPLKWQNWVGALRPWPPRTRTPFHRPLYLKTGKLSGRRHRPRRRLQILMTLGINREAPYLNVLSSPLETEQQCCQQRSQFVFHGETFLSFDEKNVHPSRHKCHIVLCYFPLTQNGHCALFLLVGLGQLRKPLV
mgnify:CR=1 FL=1